MEEYEQIGREKIESQSNEADKSINNILDNLDYRGKQEIAYGNGPLDTIYIQYLRIYLKFYNKELIL